MYLECIAWAYHWVETQVKSALGHINVMKGVNSQMAFIQHFQNSSLNQKRKGRESIWLYSKILCTWAQGSALAIAMWIIEGLGLAQTKDSSIFDYHNKWCTFCWMFQNELSQSDLLTAQKRLFFNYVVNLLPIVDYIPTRILTPNWHCWRNPFTVKSKNLHTYWHIQ